MEETKQTKNMVFIWLMIDIAFILIIMILLAIYLRTGRKNTTQDSQNDFIKYTTNWAAHVSEQVDVAEDYARILESVLKSNGFEMGDENTISYAQSVVNNSSVSHFYLKDGTSVWNESGESSLEDIGFCASASSDWNSYYVINDAVDDAQALAVNIPFVGTQKSVVAVLHMGELGERFTNCGYEDFSFLGIMEKSGEILATFPKFKDKDSAFVTGDNLYKDIADSVEKEELNIFRSRVNSSSGSAIEATINQDSRTIVVTALGTNDWSMIFGLRQNYMDRIVEDAFATTKSMIIKLVVVIAVFSAFVITTVILSNLKTKERGRQLEDKADTDLLTELNNKAATERKIQEYIDENPDGRAMMFILDIDNFKKINDTMGHAFGDTLLKTLGKEIKTEFRTTDIIGRTGGDEFMVFLKNITDDAIVEREANRITRFFHDFKAGGDYVKYSATASIGCAIFPDDAASFKDLYVAADQALYRAKKRGKNQLVFYNEQNSNA